MQGNGMRDMDYHFNVNLAANYSKPTQRIRALTEPWVKENIYCPHCGNPSIEKFPNNKPVADFYCPQCKSEYELKSKKGAIGRKIADGAYDSFIQRITSINNPNFFILNYDARELCVNNLWMIPKHFFVPDIVEKRNPLSQVAQRAGWVGCNILFYRIPVQGQISIIHNRVLMDKNSVIAQVRRSARLYTKNIDERGWLLDVLNCVNKIEKPTFELGEIYGFENWLFQKHPQNHNVRPKIRQQLQVLRDKGFIEFTGRGTYSKI